MTRSSECICKAGLGDAKQTAKYLSAEEEAKDQARDYARQSMHAPQRASAALLFQARPADQRSAVQGLQSPSAGASAGSLTKERYNSSIAPGPLLSSSSSSSPETSAFKEP